MLFRFLILVHICAAFPLKCPEPAQWSFRARSHCPDPSKYFCLRNDHINGYSENCTVKKNVLRGGLDADICSSERYQPWPINFYTNISTNCMFLKSLCNEEGQVVYSKGNRNIDITCRCDYTRGYDFLVKPRNQCFCVPSKEDCSCFLKTCSKSTHKLSPDYECLHDDENITVSECKPILYKRAPNKNKTDSILTRQNISNKGLNIAFCIGVLIIEFCWQALKNIETVVDGVCRKLKITNITQKDVGLYCLEVLGHRSGPTDLIITPMFTSTIDTQQCTEGDKIELSCSVHTANIEVKWYKKDSELHQSNNILITSSGNQHTLTIVETTVKDSGHIVLRQKTWKWNFQSQ
ncbi:unnamed protein product [Mytilus edulis]|uniref:Ig-like domain-containing protein n=1 Tax=Mytilus edulis TaxID=6550 RepID=A0A8S3V444_MYTED|nr:unnamed protein product [Mytilus edulis]